MDLNLASSFQIIGSKMLVVRLLRDLADLKQIIAANPYIDGIGQSKESTYLEAAVGYVADCAYPGLPNDAPAVFSMEAAWVLRDTTGPRLASFVLDLDGSCAYLYFNEPLSATTFNASELVFRTGQNLTASSARLGVDSTLALANSCLVKVVLGAADEANLVAAGVGQSRGSVFLQHFGGVVNDVVGGVPALSGAGPGEISADLTRNEFEGLAVGLVPSMALPEGPCATLQILDMEEGKLYVRYYHDVVMDRDVNISAVVVAAADDPDAWSYRLTNATYEAYVDYDGMGEAVIVLPLGKADVDALKLADGSSGVAPVGTSPLNTRVALDADFLKDSLGRTNVARTLGDGLLGAVKTYQTVPDQSAPTVSKVALDMDDGLLTFSMDEPVRASEALVTQITLRQGASLTAGAAMTLTADTAVTNKGSSATVELALGDADLDELKRLDNLAMNASTGAGQACDIGQRQTAPLSVVFYPFRLSFRRGRISRNGLEA